MKESLDLHLCTCLTCCGTITCCYCAVLQDDVETLASCLFSLRLLGRFLGFVHFLPYRCVDTLPSLVSQEQIAIRNQVRQPARPCGPVPVPPGLDTLNSQ